MIDLEFVTEVDGTVFDLGELVTKVSFRDVLNDGCSKLEFSYINDDLVLKNGCPVRFRYNNAAIFLGYVFKVSRSNGKEISVTAYDQLRYCKAKDSFPIKGNTVSTLVSKMCNHFHLKPGEIADTGYVLAESAQDSKTWLDIIYSAMSDTLLSKKKKYALRDEFGSITLRDLEDLTLNMVLGDESLCYGYQYDKSIDDEFYNYIKLVNKDSPGTLIEAMDKTSVQKYGILQYFDTLSNNETNAKAQDMANNLLLLYNRETETVSLDCIGDPSIRAGNSFYAYISDIGLNKRLIVKEVTHQFLPAHTMSLEVMI